MSPTRSTLVILTALSILPSAGADEIEDRLGRAISAQQGRFERARARLVEHLDKAVKTTLMAGDLDAAERLRDEKLAFRDDGELPDSDAAKEARSAFEAEVASIDADARKAFDDAAGALTEARDIEAALLVRDVKDAWVEADPTPDVRRGLLARVGPESIAFARARRAYREASGEARDRLLKTLAERLRAAADGRDLERASALLQLSEQVRKGDTLPESGLWRGPLIDAAARHEADVSDAIESYQVAGRRAVKALRDAGAEDSARDIELEALDSPAWPALTSLPRIDHDPGSAVDVEPSRDRQDLAPFRDLAPRGGVLVGFRLTYKKFFDKDLIESVRPIYQVGPFVREGARHGNAEGRSDLVLARPGYAVSGITTRTGLMLDGFRLAFKKLKSSGLDPDDQYESPSFGHTNGARPPQSPPSPTRPIVGIHGRVHNGTMHTLGLVAAP